MTLDQELEKFHQVVCKAEHWASPAGIEAMYMMQQDIMDRHIFGEYHYPRELIFEILYTEWKRKYVPKIGP